MVLPVRRSRVPRALLGPRSGPALSAAALAAVWWVAAYHGPFSSITVNDLYVYSVYRELLDAGQVPYRDFAFEYPPLSLVPIGLAGGGAAALSWLMLACALVAQRACWTLGGATAGWLMVALPVVAGALVRTHVDLLPAALTMWGLAALVRRRPTLALVLLGLGTMAKLWPAVVAACALAWLHARREDFVRPLLGFVAVVAVLGVPWLALGGADTFRFHLERPVQIESSPAAVLSLLGGSDVTGAPVRPDPYKSNGLDGGAADAVALLFVVALVAALAWSVLVVARDDVLRGAFAATLAFVALGKVLSPQYMVWLLPFAAVAWARGDLGPAALVAAASLLTQLWFPDRYFDVVERDAWAVAAVVVRDVLLVAALVATARAPARWRGPGAARRRT